MQYWRISNWLLELKKSIDCKSTWCFARFTTWSSIGLIQEKIYNSLWINKSMWCYSGFSIWSRICILTDCSEGSNKGIDKISISFWCLNNFVSNLVQHSNQSQEKDLVQQPALIHSFTNEYRSCISTWCSSGFTIWSGICIFTDCNKIFDWISIMFHKDHNLVQHLSQPTSALNTYIYCLVLIYEANRLTQSQERDLVLLQMHIFICRCSRTVGSQLGIAL